MILKLKARHFKDTEYMCNECAIGKAVKEALDLTKFPLVGTGFVCSSNPSWQGNWNYDFKPYTKHMFRHDKYVSKGFHGNSVIRIIELIKTS